MKAFKESLKNGQPLGVKLVFNDNCTDVQCVDVGLLWFPNAVLKGPPNVVKACGIDDSKMNELTDHIKDVCAAGEYAPFGCLSPRGKTIFRTHLNPQ
jgi:hypothetical protein